MALGVIAAAGTAQAQGAGTALFRPEPCDLPGITSANASRLQCGRVIVARDRDAPQDGIFSLAIVIIKARGEEVQADPVVFLAGGPGSPLTRQATQIARHEAGVIAPDRDLILVDQRGAGRSEPALCPGLARQELAIFVAGPGPGTMLRARRDAYRACRQEMAATGIRPEWFGTTITVADIEDVRQALGIVSWNVYARSYGTAVAMTMMALHPQHLRAVVLDSPYPPDPLPMTRPESFDRALGLLFAACGADPDCAAAHPDLAASFAEAMRRLGSEALPVPLLGQGGETVNLRPETFRLIVNQALYYRPLMAGLPQFIDAARDRKPAALQGLISHLASGLLAGSPGDQVAVECRDRPVWQAPDPQDGQVVSALDFRGICVEWSKPGPPASIAVNTAVPSLLLTGSIDPITPPAFARLAAAAMGAKAVVVEFANVGHDAEQSSSCGETLVTAFIRDPAGAIDATCAAHVPPVGFR